jgi:hypothetical protein
MLQGVNDMNEKKQYLIDEDTLKELLRAGHILAILERDGVDNWWGWMEGRGEYLTDCLWELPWNEGKTIEELNEIVEEEGYDIDNLIDDKINAFWEEYKDPCEKCHFSDMTY